MPKKYLRTTERDVNTAIYVTWKSKLKEGPFSTAVKRGLRKELAWVGKMASIHQRGRGVLPKS